MKDSYFMYTLNIKHVVIVCVITDKVTRPSFENMSKIFYIVLLGLRILVAENTGVLIFNFELPSQELYIVLKIAPYTIFDNLLSRTTFGLTKSKVIIIDYGYFGQELAKSLR